MGISYHRKPVLTPTRRNNTVADHRQGGVVPSGQAKEDQGGVGSDRPGRVKRPRVSSGMAAHRALSHPWMHFSFTSSEACRPENSASRKALQGCKCHPRCLLRGENPVLIPLREGHGRRGEPHVGAAG